MSSRSHAERPSRPIPFASAVARERRARERRLPRRGDPFYTHLVDLRDGLATTLAAGRGRWLDYGADSSPYRTLLGASASLRSADLPRTGAPVDHVLGEDGGLPDIGDGSFDGVLSTQVLEHVPDPARYLREAHRVLKPGGRLVLSTHGIWEDHPGPLDLHRWTLEGLSREVAAAGFEVDGCWGLSCGRRGALFLFQQQFVGGPRLAPLRRLSNLASDWLLGHERRRSAPEPKLYLTILLTAWRH
jgi:SAM-dependent methyltransferase